MGHRLLEMSPPAAPVGRLVRPARASCSRTWASPTSASCPATTCDALEETFRRALALNGPVIVHVRTQKGKGYRPAEADQISFHGAALPPMAVPGDRRRTTGSRDGDGMARRRARPSDGSRDGRSARRRRSMMADRRGRAAEPTASRRPGPADAEEDAQLHGGLRRGAGRAGAPRTAGSSAITAGMPTGTGLAKFQAAYPDRFIDVGIAEQHAVTLATGLALGGMRPVVALYSTFLQRAFDQTVHDVCQNDAPVLLAVDRAGLVGEDGTSHQGMFTIPAQRKLPEPRRSPARATSRSSGRCCARRSPRTTRSRSTTRATPASASRSASPRCSRSGGARCCARAATSCSSRSGRSRCGRSRSRTRSRREGWSVGRDQRAVREAARPAADPRPGARQAAASSRSRRAW